MIVETVPGPKSQEKSSHTNGHPTEHYVVDNLYLIYQTVEGQVVNFHPTFIANLQFKEATSHGNSKLKHTIYL